MFRRKKQDLMYNDPVTNGLINKGVYSVHHPVMVEERKFSSWREHNVISGMWYVFILSCLLWWLPVFGQMIAGYVGGRKAGSPIKGIFVAIIPVFIIILLMVCMDLGLLPFVGALAGIPTMVMNGIRSFSPNAASYLSGIYDSLKPLVGLNGNGFLIIVVFGLIGGMMADLNKKEILRATGNQPFYDAFLGKFSGAYLSKFADMVAERVIWTLGTIDYGSRNLIGRVHGGPSALGFEEMQKLPAPATYSLPEYRSEPIPHQPEKAFGYDFQSPQEDRFEEMENISSRPPPMRPQSMWSENDYWEEEPDIPYLGYEEENMIQPKQKREQKKNMNRGRKTTRNKSDVSKNRNGPQGRNKPKKTEARAKRDAEIYDNNGNLLNKRDEPKKARKPSKKKVPSLVTRALEADKKLHEKPNNNETLTAFPEKQKEDDIAPEIKPEAKPAKTRPTQSFDRL
ncbi:MAG: hypothetical protein JSV09_12225 [Thermoplasmata archaeon]|nr:MAG: hypothetical protein JSV09_12225 [Thermoplasmata archaeon]